MVHRLLFWIGLAIAFPTGVLLAQTADLGLSWSGRLYAVGLALLLLGLLTLPLRRRGTPRVPVTRLAVALLLCTFGLRATIAKGQVCHSQKEPVVATAVWPPTWLAEERDLVLVGARAVVRSGQLRRSETHGLVKALDGAYQSIEETDGPRPERVLVPITDRGGEEVSATVVHPEAAAPQAGVIFLHGYGGNFAWPCWAMAEAAAAAAVTLCPTLDIEGHWWSKRGERVVRASAAWLRARGVSRIYLAGLSNGAAGVAGLAPRLHEELDGLILISGARRSGGTAGLPSLVLHGNSDTMMPTAMVRRFVQGQDQRVRYRELDGNHFVMLHRWPEARTAISAWLDEVEATRLR